MQHINEIGALMIRHGISEHAAIARYSAKRIIAERQRSDPLAFRRATNLHK